MSQTDNAKNPDQNPENDQSPIQAAPPAVVPPKPKPELRTGARPMALVPQTIEEAARIAQAYVLAGMAPRSYLVETEIRHPDGGLQKVVDAQATQGRVLIGILKGMDVGMTPTQALSNIYIVNNIPTVYGDGIVAIIQNSPDYEWHKTTLTGKPKTDEWTATTTIKKRGRDELIVASFSWAQAKAAGLTTKKGPWTQYPERQMGWRSFGWAARDGFAKELAGLGVAEEIQDIDKELPKPVDTAQQQDAFTMKAIGQQQSTTVDFSLMGKKQEPVPVAAEIEEEAQQMAQDEAITQYPNIVTHDDEQPIPEADTAEEPQPENKTLACAVCNGRRVVESEETKEPCPECN